MHAQAKATYARHGIPWYRTDQNGTITIRSPGTPGGGYTVTRRARHDERSRPERPAKLSAGCGCGDEGLRGCGDAEQPRGRFVSVPRLPHPRRTHALPAACTHRGTLMYGRFTRALASVRDLRGRGCGLLLARRTRRRRLGEGSSAAADTRRRCSCSARRARRLGRRRDQGGGELVAHRARLRRHRRARAS